MIWDGVVPWKQGLLMASLYTNRIREQNHNLQGKLEVKSDQNLNDNLFQNPYQENHLLPDAEKND